MKLLTPPQMRHFNRLGSQALMRSPSSSLDVASPDLMTYCGAESHVQLVTSPGEGVRVLGGSSRCQPPGIDGSNTSAHCILVSKWPRKTALNETMLYLHGMGTEQD